MTPKPFIILFALMMTFLLIVGIVHAFTMGNVDGQWSRIEPDNGSWGAATNDYWASGPPGGSTEYDNLDLIFTYSFYRTQSEYGLNLYDDWNQVRYGLPTGTEVGFAGQSGFGFDGVNDLVDPSQPFVDIPLLLGKFCHFNNPIEAEDEMEWVDLEIRADDVLCPDGLSPSPDGVLQFGLRFSLDETDNYPPGEDCAGALAFCPYTIGTDTNCPSQGGVNANGCADKVDIGSLPLTDTFTCDNEGVPEEYKIGILGFEPLTDPSLACPTQPSGDYAFSMISGEMADNCFCLYGVITEVAETGVSLNHISAALVEKAVEISWETASEVNNLGFNLYRGLSAAGPKEKLNQDFIPSQVIGSTSGARYTYLDRDLLEGGNYFYWLESIDLSGGTRLYGPVNIFLTD